MGDKCESLRHALHHACVRCVGLSPGLSGGCRRVNVVCTDVQSVQLPAYCTACLCTVTATGDHYSLHPGVISKTAKKVTSTRSDRYTCPPGRYIYMHGRRGRRRLLDAPAEI